MIDPLLAKTEETEESWVDPEWLAVVGHETNVRRTFFAFSDFEKLESQKKSTSYHLLCYRPNVFAIDANLLSIHYFWF